MTRTNFLTGLAMSLLALVAFARDDVAVGVVLATVALLPLALAYIEHAARSPRARA